MTDPQDHELRYGKAPIEGRPDRDVTIDTDLIGSGVWTQEGPNGPFVHTFIDGPQPDYSPFFTFRRLTAPCLLRARRRFCLRRDRASGDMLLEGHRVCRWVADADAAIARWTAAKAEAWAARIRGAVR
jgi:hypothetical protein